MTLDRQCVYQFIDQLAAVDPAIPMPFFPSDGGRGFKAVAEVFPRNPCHPALNTTFPRADKQARACVRGKLPGCGRLQTRLFRRHMPASPACSKGLFKRALLGGPKTKSAKVRSGHRPAAWQPDRHPS